MIQSQGSITKLKEGESTAWVNSLVYHRKPRSQGSKQSYFQRASCDSYSGRNSPKTKWCQALLHCWCEMWLLECWARPGVELFNHLQFSIWPLQISVHAIWSQDVAGCIPREGRLDLWRLWGHYWNNLLMTLLSLESQNRSTIINFMVCWQEVGLLGWSLTQTNARLNMASFVVKMVVNLKVRWHSLLVNRNYRHSLDWQPTWVHLFLASAPWKPHFES